jgi:hypothetical protein
MPRVGFEPMTPVFERAKTVHMLDRAATMIGNLYYRRTKSNFAILTNVRGKILTNLNSAIVNT